MMRQTVLVALVCCLLSAASAVEGDAVYYVGGSLPGLTQEQEGRFDFSSREVLRFSGAKGKWETSYKNITRLEYGRKPGRQIAAAILISPVWLAAPKRKHFVTIQVKDADGKLQAGVFELSKARYDNIIADLEERSGVKVEVEAAINKRAAPSGKKP